MTDIRWTPHNQMIAPGARAQRRTRRRAVAPDPENSAQTDMGEMTGREDGVREPPFRQKARARSRVVRTSSVYLPGDLNVFFFVYAHVRTCRQVGSCALAQAEDGRRIRGRNPVPAGGGGQSAYRLPHWWTYWRRPT